MGAMSRLYYLIGKRDQTLAQIEGEIHQWTSSQEECEISDVHGPASGREPGQAKLGQNSGFLRAEPGHQAAACDHVTMWPFPSVFFFCKNLCKLYLIYQPCTKVGRKSTAGLHFDVSIGMFV